MGVFYFEKPQILACVCLVWVYTAISKTGERKEPPMKVTTFSINTTDGKRYGLKNAKTGQVLYGATAKYKTESGAVNYAKRHGYEF